MTPISCELRKAERNIHAIEGVALCVDKAACLGRVAARIQRNLSARIDRGGQLLPAAAPRENANKS